MMSIERHSIILIVDLQQVFGHCTSNCSGVFCKKYSQKFHKIHKINTCAGIFFNKVAAGSMQLYQKKIPTLMFSCEFCENLKNTYFIERHQATAFCY